MSGGPPCDEVHRSNGERRCDRCGKEPKAADDEEPKEEEEEEEEEEEDAEGTVTVVKLRKCSVCRIANYCSKVRLCHLIHRITLKYTELQICPVRRKLLASPHQTVVLRKNRGVNQKNKYCSKEVLKDTNAKLRKKRIILSSVWKNYGLQPTWDARTQTLCGLVVIYLQILSI